MLQLALVSVNNFAIIVLCIFNIQPSLPGMNHRLGSFQRCRKRVASNVEQDTAVFIYEFRFCLITDDRPARVGGDAIISKWHMAR